MSASYVFRAVDGLGVKHKGEIEADSAAGVTELLKGRGLIALEVKTKTKSMELSFESLTRVTLEDLSLMTRQLSTMISSGLSLMRALMVLESQTQNKRLRSTVISIRQDIETGASLSGALAKHPKIFSELFVAMIRAGETGGFLESALIRVADQLEAQHKLRRQVKSAMVYPAVVTSIALVVVVAMLVFIIPVFAGVFKQFNGKMPSLTVHTIAVSQRDPPSVVLLSLRLARPRLRLSQVEGVQGGTAGLGSLPAQGPRQDRDRSSRRSRSPAGRAPSRR